METSLNKSKHFYILREKYKETYDCPDNGLTDICDVSIDISISSNKEKLEEIAKELNLGFNGGYWSGKKNNRLRSLYSGYDCMRDSKFIVEDITELFID